MEEHASRSNKCHHPAPEAGFSGCGPSTVRDPLTVSGISSPQVDNGQHRWNGREISPAELLRRLRFPHNLPVVSLYGAAHHLGPEVLLGGARSPERKIVFVPVPEWEPTQGPLMGRKVEEPAQPC